MFSISRIAMTGTAAAALMFAGTAPTLAQEEATEAPAQLQTQTEIKPVTDQEIETFVAATVEIQTIMQEWQPKLQEAQGTEEAPAVQKELQEEMVAAVKDEGMTPQRYNEINMLAAKDPELLGRIEAVIES